MVALPVRADCIRTGVSNTPFFLFWRLQAADHVEFLYALLKVGVGSKSNLAAELVFGEVVKPVLKRDEPLSGDLKVGMFAELRGVEQRLEAFLVVIEQVAVRGIPVQSRFGERPCGWVGEKGEFMFFGHHERLDVVPSGLGDVVVLF